MLVEVGQIQKLMNVKSVEIGKILKLMNVKSVHEGTYNCAHVFSVDELNLKCSEIVH